MINVKIRCRHCFLKIACGDDFKGSKISCPGCKETIRIPTPTYDLGTNIHGFTIEQWLGNGAMGEVYLSRQESMDRLVALKIMPKIKLQDDEDQQRFVREVRTLATLNHPNIVSAIEAGEYLESAYLAMSFIDGVTAEDKINKEGVFSEIMALKVCETIADALEHAWDHCKLIHRDLKPANFMIDSQNKIHLMDMGIAKRVDHDMDLTAVGIVMGTPYYMSPEQAKGEKGLDLRSDIYSLGASMYHMLTGHAPYEEMGTSSSVMSGKLHKPPKDPRNFNPNLSKPIVKLIKKMMTKDIAKRPQTWQEVKKMVRDARKSRKSSSGSMAKSNPRNSSEGVQKTQHLPMIIFSLITFIVIATVLLLVMIE